MLLPIVRTQWLSLYLLLFAFGGFFLFLYGFFPLKYHGGEEASWKSVPQRINNVQVDWKKLYFNNRTRVVLMVIDALRYDFVNTQYMPYTTNMVAKGKACLYKAHAEPPTVTMPRIKSTIMKRDKAQWRRTLNFWRDLFAMTTGSVSNFIDVVLNFGSSAVADDNFLNQAKLNNKIMVFYGDDTWLKLFPDAFLRSEGTTSFYVSDYSEVDLNVTRNLNKELKTSKPDWDLMILHYLGLDHIGHLEGPLSPKTVPKMLEMDNIISVIMNASKKWDDETVLIVCGDHGMKDSGGHGGASVNEITVPLVITQNKGCSSKLIQDVDQIDIAPTISYLLGLPIPSVSTGQILPQILSSNGELLSNKALYALYYNAQINSEAFLKYLGREEAINKECFKRYISAIHYHEDWLKTSNKNSAKTASMFYQDSMMNMAHYLTKSLVEYDMYAIILGIILIAQTLIAQLLVSFTTFNPEKNSDRYFHIQSHKKHAIISRGILIFFVIIACSFIFKVSCGVSQTNSAICKINPLSISAIVAIIGILVTNAVIIQNIRNNLPVIESFESLNSIETFLIISSIVHPLTYGGTSFIEEEHQTWYFCWTTLTFLIFAYTGRILLEYYHKKCENATEVQDKESLNSKMNMTAKTLLPQWILLMILHRILRTFNQTGDKWAFLPDLADWLNKDEHNEILSLLSLAALFSTAIICQNNLQNSIVPYKTNCLLITGATICIYLYRVVTLTIHIPFIGPISLNEIYVIRTFWIIIILIIMSEIISSKKFLFHELSVKIIKLNEEKQKLLTSGYKNESYTYTARNIYSSSEKCDITQNSSNLGFLLSSQTGVSLKVKVLTSRATVFLNIVMLVCSLYLRPHNLLLVPSMFITSNLINKILDFKSDTRKYISSTNCEKNIFFKTLSHIWIGGVFYFYQGNSNSLASVDLGSGYIGLESYIPFIVALQMGIHTFTGPLLAGSLLFTNIIQENRDWKIFLNCLKMCISTIVPLRVYTLLVYTIICAILRYHLFVWTVISPKLLYEFMLTFFTFNGIVIVSLSCALIVFQENLIIKYINKFNAKVIKTIHKT